MNSNANIIYITPPYNHKVLKENLQPHQHKQLKYWKSNRDIISNNNSSEMNHFFKKQLRSKEANCINQSKINNSFIPRNNDSVLQKFSRKPFLHLGKNSSFGQQPQNNSKLYLLKSHIRSLSVLNNKYANKPSIPPIIPLHFNKSNERIIKNANHSRGNYDPYTKNIKTGKTNSNNINNTSKSISRSSSEYLRVNPKLINAVYQ